VSGEPPDRRPAAEDPDPGKRRLLLRPALVLAAALGAAFGSRHLLEQGEGALGPGKEAPSLRLPSLGGAERDLASHRGKLVLLNFWATWCPPCVDEMPSLERLHRTLAGEGLRVVSVSTDEDEPALRRFAAEHRLTLEVLRDPGGRKAAAAYRVTGYPVTFLIGRGGVIEERWTGPAEWDTPEAIAHFRGRLGLPSSPAPP